MKSTCRKCGTRFGICIVANQVSSPPADSHEVAPSGDASQDEAAAASVVWEHESHTFSFWGSGGSLLGIHIVNFFLTLVTFGIYTFWGKVRIREYLWSQTQFVRDRFAYHGTGKELLKGFSKAAVIFGIPYVLLVNGPSLAGASASIHIAAQLLTGCLLLVFIPVAIVAARRYRLSRTSWRGIRFSFRGSVLGFLKVFLTGMFLNILTLGAYYPFFDVKRHGYLTSHSYLGNQKFSFDGEGWDLVKYFLYCYLLTPITLGLCWFWYAAQRKRYFWEHTFTSKARFQFPITGGALFKLHFGNFLILVFTLGFAWPWVTIRNIDFVASYLTLNGSANLDSIVQESQAATATGEGLDGFLDTGIEFG